MTTLKYVRSHLEDNGGGVNSTSRGLLTLCSVAIAIAAFKSSVVGFAVLTPTLSVDEGVQLCSVQLLKTLVKFPWPRSSSQQQLVKSLLPVQ